MNIKKIVSDTGKNVTMLGLLTSNFGYQNRLTLLQELIECGDILIGNELVYGTYSSHNKKSQLPATSSA